MSGAKKSARLLVKLVSTAKTGTFYVTEKNPRNTPWKLKLIKFDPKVASLRSVLPLSTCGRAYVQLS
jgi:large subunit ribosomal protein L33